MYITMVMFINSIRSNNMFTPICIFHLCQVEMDETSKEKYVLNCNVMPAEYVAWMSFMNSVAAVGTGMVQSNCYYEYNP